ncbi:hypothetical protein N7488_000755 [Penicillium malachiteum]|nr:hypothetical protein N7488_000755 [Penicillium malachiteum]
MSETWSHLTQNPLSTTPGFLGEIYNGETYEIKSEPSYGPNNQPSSSAIESAVSAANSGTETDGKTFKGYLPSESWWAHCRRTTTRCTIWCTVGVFLLVITVGTILILMATNVIYVAPRKPLPPLRVKDDPTEPNPPLMQRALMNQTPINTGVLPTGTTGPLPTGKLYSIANDTVTVSKVGFVTRVRPSPTKH